MADVNSGQSKTRSKKGGPKTKKQSTKIDMTAMVDVAFLLLTFFVLTATMNKPKMMELAMPPLTDDLKEEDKKIKVKESKIMTLILDRKDTVRWYTGITDPKIKAATFAPNGIRKIISGHITDSIGTYGELCTIVSKRIGEPTNKNCWDPIFVVKARPGSKYKNLVDLIDELNIVGAPKYAIDKFTDQDSLLIIGEFDPIKKRVKSKNK